MDSRDDKGSPSRKEEHRGREDGQNGEKVEGSGHSPRGGSREGSPSRGVAVDDPKRSTPKIVISNMSSNVTVDHLREICSLWGSIEDIRVEADGEKTCAVVEFSKRTEAQDALDHMHRMSLDHQEILVSFTVDDDPRTAVPLSAYGQVSHKEDSGSRTRRRDGNPTASDAKKDDRPPRNRGNRRGRSPPRRGDRQNYRDYDRGRSPPRYSDSHRPIRYDDRDRPPYPPPPPPRDRSPRRYEDRYDRRDKRDYGRYDDRRSSFNRPRSPVHDRHPRRDSPPRRYGSPEPKRPFLGDRSPERSGYH